MTGVEVPKKESKVKFAWTAGCFAGRKTVLGELPVLKFEPGGAVYVPARRNWLAPVGGLGALKQSGGTSRLRSEAREAVNENLEELQEVTLEGRAVLESRYCDSATQSERLVGNQTTTARCVLTDTKGSL